jgi:hypothetical protein
LRPFEGLDDRYASESFIHYVSDENRLKIPVNLRALCGAIAIGGMIAVVGGLDTFLRAYNEVSAIAEPGPIKTKIGDYISSKRMGTLPVRLIWALKKWPDRDSCLSDPARAILKWDEFAGEDDMEVCLTRVLNQAKTSQTIVSILAENGFSSPSVSSLGPQKDVTVVSVNCGKTAMPCGSAVANFWSFVLTPYEFTVSVSRSDEQILDVKVVPSVL